MTREDRDRLRGFLGFAEIHAIRGNLDAVREALDDARALLDGEGSADGSVDDDEVMW